MIPTIQAPEAFDHLEEIPQWCEYRAPAMIQLNLQTNVVQNNLTITFSPEELREIEVQAEPVRQSVRKMYQQYRPILGNGNGQAAAPIPPADTGEKNTKAERGNRSADPLGSGIYQRMMPLVLK
jgi:hypothetical protein